MAHNNSNIKALLVEFLGTALLVGAQVGVGYSLAGLGGLTLVGIAIVSAFALAIAITIGGQVSGGHFNPAVTIALTMTGNAPVRNAVPYIVAQLAGALAGAVTSNTLWGGAAISSNLGEAPGVALLLSELLATAVLVGIVVAMVRRQGGAGLNWLVPAWVGTAILLTPSGCMANPAVAFGHMFTNSTVGLGINAVAPFIGIQILAALIVAGVTIAVAPKKAAAKASK
jgi:glycerol uptake facilitator-like aquaporin